MDIALTIILCFASGAVFGYFAPKLAGDAETEIATLKRLAEAAEARLAAMADLIEELERGGRV